MSKQLRCECGEILQVPEQLRARRGRCPSCARIVDIPDQVEEIAQLEPYSEGWESYFRDMWSEFSDFVFGSTGEAQVQPPYTPEEIYEKSVQAVVVVQSSACFGSGVIIDPEGIVITNRHVVKRDHELCIITSGGEQLQAKTLRICRDLDLAFVKADLANATYAEFARARAPKVGQSVFAMGHPNSLQNTFTRGIISGVGEGRQEILSGWPYILTDAVMVPGFSGGPLFDEFGQIIGINTEVTPGLGCAVPADLCYDRYSELKKRLQDGRETCYCSVCNETSVASDYCDRCGASLGVEKRPTQPLAAEQNEVPIPPAESDMMVNACAKLVESFLRKTGKDPDEHRLVDKDISGWAWDHEEATLFITIQSDQNPPTLSIVYPMFFLPDKNALALYRKLLELNMEIQSCGFSVTQDKIYLVSERPVRGLDEEELEDTVKTVLNYARDVTDALAHEFMAPKFADQSNPFP